MVPLLSGLAIIFMVYYLGFTEDEETEDTTENVIETSASESEF